jgi:hypothetical protein
MGCVCILRRAARGVGLWEFWIGIIKGRSGSGAKGGSAFEKGILLDGAAMGEGNKGGPAKYVCLLLYPAL